MLFSAMKVITSVSANTLLLFLTVIAASPLKVKNEFSRNNEILLKYTSEVESPDYMSRLVHHPVKRSVCLERAEENELLDYEHVEESNTWWHDLKDWDGWNEAWGRFKDVVGATLANVFGGRILEHWYAFESGRTGRNMGGKKYDWIGKRYNFYFVQYNVVADETVH